MLGFACGQFACFKLFWPLALAQRALAAIIFHALRRLGGVVLFRSSRPSPSWGFPFWPSGLTVRRSRPPTAAAELRALVQHRNPLYSRSCFFNRHSVSQALFSAWFAVSPGFAFGRFACFKPFWPLAFAQQALPAIIFHALRRLGGVVLFRGSRPSPSWGFPFWPSGLTIRRSRPPTAAAELRALVPRRNRFIWPMLIQTAFSFSGVIQRLVCRLSGLRLRAVCLFQVFLTSGPCTASATSYHFSCAASPRPRWPPQTAPLMAGQTAPGRTVGL